MRDVNGAGYDPRVEDINPPRSEDNECEECNVELITKITADGDIYYVCPDCENIS